MPSVHVPQARALALGESALCTAHCASHRRRRRWDSGGPEFIKTGPKTARVGPHISTFAMVRGWPYTHELSGERGTTEDMSCASVKRIKDALVRRHPYSSCALTSDRSPGAWQASYLEAPLFSHSCDLSLWIFNVYAPFCPPLRCSMCTAGLVR